ncbi:hypothetical protein [Dyadobacter flavalbus]|nr:hypothetical protein [Dyadobacter flavalbus]
MFIIAVFWLNPAICQTTFSITIPQDVATKQWVETYVKQKMDSLKSATAPVVSLPPCAEGPTILDITNITKDYLTFKFHGKGVEELYWVINGIAASTAGTVEPKSNLVKISFQQLPKGEYALSISGTKCSGTSTQSFKVK